MPLFFLHLNFNSIMWFCLLLFPSDKQGVGHKYVNLSEKEKRAMGLGGATLLGLHIKQTHNLWKPEKGENRKPGANKEIVKFLDLVWKTF